MEKIKWDKKNKSLRVSFMIEILKMVLVVAALSASVIWGCISFQSWLLPNPESVCLTISATYADGVQRTVKNYLKYGEKNQGISILFEDENSKNQTPEDVNYSIEKIEGSYASLTPKRQFAYRFAGICMIALPALFSLAGIIFCAFSFYKRKLEPPIRILSEGAKHIYRQDLDFTIQYEANNEMGDLCLSFERMRQTLYDNNRKLWEALDESKKLQASVSHDLRNPISIILGYTEYLQLNIPEKRISEEELLTIVENIAQSAKRVEDYTESIRGINHLEELEVHLERCKLEKFVHELAEDFIVLVEQKGLQLNVRYNISEEEGEVDRQVIHRIMENIISNATRYAEDMIEICFTAAEGRMIITVCDDGEGFTKAILKRKGTYYYTINQKTGHMGMGLSISSILCRKHGGELILKNREPKGACVVMEIEI